MPKFLAFLKQYGRCGLLLLLILAGAPLCLALEPPKAGLVNQGQYDCLPASTFGLSGVRLWEPKDSLRTLGKPRSITKSSGEDDGGGYEITTYHYRDFDVDIVRGAVDRIHTSSNGIRTPEGIRVGDNRADVVKKLGRPPRDWKPAELEAYISVCPGPNGIDRTDTVKYRFDGAGRLRTISYEANRP